MKIGVIERANPPLRNKCNEMISAPWLLTVTNRHLRCTGAGRETHLITDVIFLHHVTNVKP
jgi:hypothetical protein